MKETFSNEVRFRAKVNDHVPPNELLAWADKIENLEAQLAGALEVIERYEEIKESVREGVEEARNV